MEIINRILELLHQNHLTQTDICKHLGIKTNVFTTWKTRGTDPPTKYIIQICDFLNVTPEYLLTGKERCADEKEKGNNIHTGNVTNSKIVGGHDNSSNSFDSISDDALEIDKIIKSFEPKKRAKFLYQVYDLAEKLKDNWLIN